MSRFFNLSLDDQSPHPKAGLNFEAILQCQKLIKKYPNIKIDLFIPAAFCRLKENPYWLHNNKDWIAKMKDLGPNFQFCLHGLYHRRSKWPLSNNDEFQFLTYDETNTLLKTIENEFKIVGLSYSKIIRPPGWKISEFAVKYLSDRGFLIAGDQKHYQKLKNKIPKLKWISYNWDLQKECNIVIGDIICYGHTSLWTNNFFNDSKRKLIEKILDSSANFEFKFINDLERTIK